MYIWRIFEEQAYIWMKGTSTHNFNRRSGTFCVSVWHEHKTTWLIWCDSLQTVPPTTHLREVILTSRTAWSTDTVWNLVLFVKKVLGELIILNRVYPSYLATIAYATEYAAMGETAGAVAAYAYTLLPLKKELDWGHCLQALRSWSVLSCRRVTFQCRPWRFVKDECLPKFLLAGGLEHSISVSVSDGLQHLS